MAENSNIEWTDHTWNPWIGCTKVSAGCARCYAETQSHRFGMDVWGKGKPRQRTSEANWKKPYQWNKAAAEAGRIDSVFTLSMGDILDPEVPQEWLNDAWRVMCECQNLRWLVLTKRPEELERLRNALEATGAVPKSFYLGTSIENEAVAEKRWRELFELWTLADMKIRGAEWGECGTFFSCEPLLEDPWLGKIWREQFKSHPAFAPDWVIIGGESGPKARQCCLEDVRSVMADAREMRAKVFVKQLGAKPFWDGGEDDRFLLKLRDKKGGDMAEWDKSLRVRELPWG